MYVKDIWTVPFDPAASVWHWGTLSSSAFQSRHYTEAPSCGSHSIVCKTERKGRGYNPLQSKDNTVDSLEFVIAHFFGGIWRGPHSLHSDLSIALQNNCYFHGHDFSLFGTYTWGFFWSYHSKTWVLHF